MDSAAASALIGLAGVGVGALLSGAGKYWTGRRDAWRQARASGLLVLGDLRALNQIKRTGDTDQQSLACVRRDAARTAILTWAAQREILAAFRPGTYPNGLTASQWLELSDRFARLAQLEAEHVCGCDERWWSEARSELQGAQENLACFENDPRVVWHAIKKILKRT